MIKTTADVRKSILRSFQDLAIPAAIAFCMAVFTSYLLSSYLTGVITDLAGAPSALPMERPGYDWKPGPRANSATSPGPSSACA